MTKLKTVKETADILSISPSMVYKLYERGALEGTKLNGSALRFEDSAIQGYIEKCKLSAAPNAYPNEIQNENSYYNHNFR
jgi:excisionase family DNA binding protein